MLDLKEKGTKVYIYTVYYIHTLAEFLALIWFDVSLFVSLCQYSLDFKLHPEELERWFTKIDHIFEHTRIPKIGAVLSPFYKISVDKGQRHHLPIVSNINYK